MMARAGRAGGGRGGQAIAALLLGCAVPSGTAVDVITSLTQLPLGCFNFGYQYTPAIPNITNPVLTGSALLCQRRCAATPGCGTFGYWPSNQECWLGPSGADIIRSITLGAISGPSACQQDSLACSAIPGAGFPGATAEESRQAWPSGQQPTSLQCWPRKANGFPATCENQTAMVLQDTLTDWPGRCEGLMRITNLGPTETCQTRCFGSPLCGVWAVENTSSSDGSLTCWQGMFGQNCYDSQNGLSPPAGAYFRAQRVMHGTFRVLMNTAGMQIKNLTKAFGVENHPHWVEGAKACRMTCLSYLLCQYWQYSDVYGCFVEDSMSNVVNYPLVNDGVEMTTGTYWATTIKAGEYIQHTCKPGPKQPWPTDPPAGGAIEKDRTVVPKYGSVDDGVPEDVELTEGSPGPPIWASMLIVVTIALCLGVIGAAVWMSLLDRDKMGSSGKGLGAMFTGSDDSTMHSMGYGSRTQSFHSDASGQPLVGQPAHQSWFGGGTAFHGLHLGGGQGSFMHPGAMPPPGMGDPRVRAMHDPRYTGMLTRDGIMQYAHQGY